MEWNQYFCQEQQQNRVDRERQADYQEAVMEQKAMNVSIKNYSDRDERDFQDKQDQVQHEREDMANSKHDREVSKEQDRQFEVREDRQIEEQVQMVLDRSFHAAEEKQHLLDEKTAKNDVVCEQMMHNKQLQEARQDRDDMRTLVHQVEDNAKYDQYNIDEKDNTERLNKEMTDGLDSQIEYKRSAAVEERAEAVAYRKRTDLRLAEGDAKELEDKRKIRESNLAYAQDLRNQMEEDKKRKLAEKDSYNAWTGYY